MLTFLSRHNFSSPIIVAFPIAPPSFYVLITPSLCFYFQSQIHKACHYILNILNAYIHAHIYSHTYIHTYHVHKYTQRHTHTYTHAMYAKTHTHTYTQTYYVPTYIQTCTHTYTHTIYTYIQTYRCFIFEQDLVVFAHRNAEDDCGHVLKAVNPFLSL